MNCDSQTEQKFQLWKKWKYFLHSLVSQRVCFLENFTTAKEILSSSKSSQNINPDKSKVRQVQRSDIFVMSARCMDFKVFLTGFKEKTEKHQKQYFTKQAKREWKMKSPVASVATFDEMKFDSRYLIDLWLSWRAQYNKQWVSKGHPCLVLGFNWTSGNNDMVEL